MINEVYHMNKKKLCKIVFCASQSNVMKLGISAGTELQ
jgi:hypothetical protein